MASPTVSYRLDDGLRRRVEAFAHTRGIGVSEAARTLLLAGLAAEESELYAQPVARMVRELMRGELGLFRQYQEELLERDSELILTALEELRERDAVLLSALIGDTLADGGLAGDTSPYSTPPGNNAPARTSLGNTPPGNNTPARTSPASTPPASTPPAKG
jgi:hypothetical protein